MNNLQKSLGKGIGTFIAAILIFLSTIFPNNKGLMVYRQGQDNSLKIYGPVIVEAVKNKDVETLKGLMCANIKRNVQDLDGKIHEMYDLIEGDYISSEWDEHLNNSASMSESREAGTINQNAFNMKILTTAKHYHISAVWETINNMKPEETKIRAIYLGYYLPTDENGITRTVRIYEIEATDGLMKWHD